MEFGDAGRPSNKVTHWVTFDPGHFGRFETRRTQRSRGVVRFSASSALSAFHILCRRRNVGFVQYDRVFRRYAATMPSISTLTILVPDLSAARKFYCDLLQFNR